MNEPTVKRYDYCDAGDPECVAVDVTELIALETAYAALTRRVQELEVDAERYRWLRSNSRGADTLVACHNDDPEGLDAAIDTALSRESGDV